MNLITRTNHSLNYTSLVFMNHRTLILIKLTSLFNNDHNSIKFVKKCKKYRQYKTLKKWKLMPCCTIHLGKRFVYFIQTHQSDAEKNNC